MKTNKSVWKIHDRFIKIAQKNPLNICIERVKPWHRMWSQPSMLKTRIHCSNAFSILTCLIICLYTMNKWNVQCTLFHYVFDLLKMHIYLLSACIQYAYTHYKNKKLHSQIHCIKYGLTNPDDGKQLVHTSKLSVVMWPCLPLKSVGFEYINSSSGYIVVAEKYTTVLSLGCHDVKIKMATVWP